MTAPVAEHRPARHSAFLVGIAQRGVDNVIAFASDLGPEARQMLVELRAQLGDVHEMDQPAINRGRRATERHDDLQAFIEAVRS